MIKLPNTIQTQDDLVGLIQDIRKKDPKPSAIVSSFWEANPKLSEMPEHRGLVIDELEKLSKVTKVATCTFASEPDQEMLQDILEWLRENIHPCIMLDIQLDPLIVGGMVLRTPQHIYDLSWYKLFDQTKPQLMEAISHAN